MSPKPPLGPGDLAKIREERAAGASVAELAERYDRSPPTIRRYCKGIAFKHVAPRTRPVDDEETAAMWRMYVSGMSQTAIGREYGLGQSAVSDRLAVFRESIPRESREMILARELDLLTELRRRQMAMVIDGRLKAETRLAAADRLLKGMERMAKMLGLDAPATAQVDTTVRYEVIGVDADAHT